MKTNGQDLCLDPQNAVHGYHAWHFFSLFLTKLQKNLDNRVKQCLYDVYHGWVGGETIFWDILRATEL